MGARPKIRDGSFPGSLFEGEPLDEGVHQSLGDGAVLLCGFASDRVPDLLNALGQITAASPFRHMAVRGGRRMSVAMTNCGSLGWISDETGYRYDVIDPLSGCNWPEMPAAFEQLATAAAAEAGFKNFAPDACLVNRYEPGAQMGLHRDADEGNYAWPIVSVSIGLPAVFLFGGLRRRDPLRRLRLESGDVVVWGGPTRLAYHGVAKLANGNHPLTGPFRINLTFRKAGV